MKIDAMLEWSPEERVAKQREWTQSLFTLRLQKATGQLENPMKIRELRKDLARLATLGSMKNVPAPKAAAPAGEASAPAAPKTATAKAAKKAKKAPAKKATPAKKAAPAKKPAPAKKAGKARKAGKAKKVKA